MPKIIFRPNPTPPPFPPPTPVPTENLVSITPYPWTDENCIIKFSGIEIPQNTNIVSFQTFDVENQDWMSAWEWDIQDFAENTNYEIYMNIEFEETQGLRLAFYDENLSIISSVPLNVVESV